MDDISLRNLKAITNGTWGEQQAGRILEDKFGQVDYINDLIDYYLNDKTPIEVKTCQVRINTGIEKYPTRPGKFSLRKDQHDFLLQNNGLYIFIVKNERLVHGYKIVPASKIPFKMNIPWNKLIYRKE